MVDLPYLERADCLFLILDTRGHVMQMNRNGCRWLGIDPAEIVGENWFDLFCPATHRQQSRRMYQIFMEEQGPGRSSYQYPVILRGGARKNLLWFHTVLLDDSNARCASILLGQAMREDWNDEHHSIVHKAHGPSNRTYRLSPKERQIAEFIKEGRTSREISGELNISRLTVDRHRNNIRKKLEVPRSMRLVEYLKLYL